MGICCGKLPYEDLQEPEFQPKWVEKAKTTEDRIVLQVDPSFSQEEIAERRDAIMENLRSKDFIETARL